MSWLSEAFTYLRRLAVLDAEVARITKATDSMKDELSEHDVRLMRIETILEMHGYGRPGRPLRLPRD